MSNSPGGSPRSRSPRGSPKLEVEIPPLWEPVFPPKEKLLSLEEEGPSSPRLRFNMPAYNKQNLSPTSRAVDGWRAKNDTVPMSEERKQKMALISDILCRWWYVFPKWPPGPEEFDYAKALRKLGYKEVPISEWMNHQDPDPEGLKKVYQLGQFPGIFRNAQQEMLDMRPKNTCPCYANLQRQDITQLFKYAIRAYENQIDVLYQVKGHKYQQLIEKLRKSVGDYKKMQASMIKYYQSAEGKKARNIELEKLRKF